MKNDNSTKQTLASVRIQSIKLQEALSFASNLTFFPPTLISSFRNAELSH